MAMEEAGQETCAKPLPEGNAICAVDHSPGLGKYPGRGKTRTRPLTLRSSSAFGLNEQRLRANLGRFHSNLEGSARIMPDLMTKR